MKYLMYVLILLCFLLTACRGETPRALQHQAQPEPEEAAQQQVLVSKDWQQPENTHFLYFMQQFFAWEQASQQYYVKYPLMREGQQLQGPEQWQAVGLHLTEGYLTSLHYGTSSAWGEKGLADTLTMQVLNLESRQVQQYSFCRENHRWYLWQMTASTLAQHPEREFVEFIERYSNNKDYQLQATLFPLELSTLDDDYEIIEKSIQREDWQPVELTSGGILVMLSTTGSPCNQTTAALYSTAWITGSRYGGPSAGNKANG